MLHSPKFEVTPADLKTYLDQMIDLLKDPGLKNYASAHRAIDDIEKVIILNNSFIRSIVVVRLRKLSFEPMRIDSELAH